MKIQTPNDVRDLFVTVCNHIHPRHGYRHLPHSVYGDPPSYPINADDINFRIKPPSARCMMSCGPRNGSTYASFAVRSDLFDYLANASMSPSDNMCILGMVCHEAAHLRHAKSKGQSCHKHDFWAGFADILQAVRDNTDLHDALPFAVDRGFLDGVDTYVLDYNVNKHNVDRRCWSQDAPVTACREYMRRRLINGWTDDEARIDPLIRYDDGAALPNVVG